MLGAADIVVIAEDAQCSFAEVRIGVIPAIISVVCLPKLGTHHGMRLFLTGVRFSGVEAVDMGLAHRAVPKAELAAEVQAEIDLIRLGGPTAVRECKKLVQQVPALSRETASSSPANGACACSAPPKPPKAWPPSGKSASRPGWPGTKPALGAAGAGLGRRNLGAKRQRRRKEGGHA